jgi:hypothetical protein
MILLYAGRSVPGMHEAADLEGASAALRWPLILSSRR